MKSRQDLSYFFSLLVLSVFSLPVQAQESWERINQSKELLWGADANGGAPYVFFDANDPSRIIGFEVDILEAVGKRLNLKPKVVIVPWDQLVPALLRKDFDLVFNGLEITEDRKGSVDFTIPYYFFSEQITVRKENTKISKFEDLTGRKVGALSASLAQKILEADPKITTIPYPSPVEVYKDLEIGRIEAALQDVPIAAWYIPQNPKLKNVGGPVGEHFTRALSGKILRC